MYTSQLVLLRKRVLKAFTDYQSSPGFVYNGFSCAESHIPLAKLTDPAVQAGKLYVVGWVTDDGERKTRGPGASAGGVNPLVTREALIQVSYQQANVLADNVTQLDTLCGLTEQLRDAVKNADYHGIFGNETTGDPLWLRNEILKDEDGTPYTYYMLREANTFETYFNAWFSYPHQ